MESRPQVRWQVTVTAILPDGMTGMAGRECPAVRLMIGDVEVSRVVGFTKVEL